MHEKSIKSWVHRLQRKNLNESHIFRISCFHGRKLRFQCIFMIFIFEFRKCFPFKYFLSCMPGSVLFISRLFYISVNLRVPHPSITYQKNNSETKSSAISVLPTQFIWKIFSVRKFWKIIIFWSKKCVQKKLGWKAQILNIIENGPRSKKLHIFCVSG